VLAQAQPRAAITGGNGDSSGRSGSATPSLTSQTSTESPAMQLSGMHPGIQRANDSGMASKKAPDDRLNKITRFAEWIAESNVDIEAMVDCTQELIAFYECHEQYNDKHAREQINRFIKARQL
jgi:cyclin C